MSSQLSTSRVRELLVGLRGLVVDRAKREAEIKSRFESRTAAERATGERDAARIETAARAERKSADEEYQQTRDHLLATTEERLRAARGEFGRVREDTLDRYQAEDEAVRHEHQEARWAHEGVHEATVKQAKDERHQTLRGLGEQELKVKELRETVREVLEDWKLVPQAADNLDPEMPQAADVVAVIDGQIAEARHHLSRLRALLAPRLLVGDRLLWIALGTWIAVSLSGFFLSPWYLGPIIATPVAVLGTLGLRYAVASRSRSQSARICKPLFRALAEADRLLSKAVRVAEEACSGVIAESERRCKDEVRKADKEFRQQLAAALLRRDRALQSAEKTQDEAVTTLTATRDSELARIEKEYRHRTSDLDQRREREISVLTQRREREKTESLKEFGRALRELSDAWSRGCAAARAEIESISRDNGRLFPDWHAPAWRDWQPSAEVPGGIQFGTLAVDTSRFPGSSPANFLDGSGPALQLKSFEPATFEVPALLPFPHRCATVLRTADTGRAAGVQALQAMMARFLTAVPPGKVRFTIIDPVGLGENFAAFMHLADHDERLVGSNIWVETAHIEKQLADLTAHMQNVIQKYLRNQYESLEEYNAKAGEVAEPYRVLVVANFPAGFSTDAARRLVSIAASGASCGVYTLVSVDTKQPLPQGFAMADLEQPSLVLDGRGGRFVWRDDDFEEYPLTMDTPPDATTLRTALDVVGRKAKEAGRVEVDFEFIAPQSESWWTNDSRKGIAVPLGRAGATKRQVLQLGQGTSQHALVAGKTGSGKSTLLHALITNLALHYGPDEVELYLIDFKKGVEFKTYATHALPHARVVAVESEREFGLSVLQRLDGELKRRGDLFRAAGVQDVAAYRGSVQRAGVGAAVTLPRILLIVDEFQEFFVEDDRVSQEAALLLDRLVRQGRAFGLHVLLGSQTLGGAYSLARSTIDQMAIRIALQCSEADANLILSKDNNAARLLSRPGEAIYNDANGLLEGNDVFQVVWLPEERRERYLRRVQELANRRGWEAPAPMIVFEGNHPADITKNHLLRQALDGEAPASRERVAWLGDALAIKDPTAAVFRRQTGSNLLIIGQQGESARTVMTAGLVALAAQTRPSEPASFTILDGSTADDPQAPWFGRLAKVLPGARVAGPREVAPAVAALSEELARRLADPDVAAPPVFLAVYGLHRFRDLRKTEDDFGFGRRGEERTATPAEQFGELLREGPAHGIHLLVWCDTLANTTRAVDRAGLREFDMRVLFQMGVNDSSTLIDSPLASRLGLHRALFASEEMATPEKFRPYSLPDEEWLEGVRRALNPRQPVAAT